MVINRDFNRTENDDWTLNVQPQLTEKTESVPLYSEGQVIGWRIQGRYE